MSETTLATTNGSRDEAAIMERVLMVGDLEELTASERLNYYMALCRSLGLNPLSRPFAFVKFDKQLQLYARKDCAEQLRRIHGVSIIDLKAQQTGDLYVVTATARDAHGRTDVDQGVVETGNLRGQFLANAWMRAATKAKRRVTLSLCGLGIVDEAELETIQGARLVEVDMATGEILPSPAALPPASAKPLPEPDPQQAAHAGRKALFARHMELMKRGRAVGVKVDSITGITDEAEIAETLAVIEAKVVAAEAKQEVAA